uniref:Uncharacterized protein n=1 Tax=viral metagenome TaxID=1070528 RepID=A0A6H1ZKA9_9ZZZZ
MTKTEEELIKEVEELSKKYIIPFPIEWCAKLFPKELEKWIEYIGSKSLSNIKYTFSQHSYRGPIHVRGMWKRVWYLFLDDRDSTSIRIFRLPDYPMEGEVTAYDEGRGPKKYLDFEGETEPDTRFNPNLKIKGEIKILSRGSVDYNTGVEEGEEIIRLKFLSGNLKGIWELIQEEKGSDTFTFKRPRSLGGEKGTFVYHKHTIRNKYHYDLRYMKEGSKIVDEFNLYSDLREGESKASKKECFDQTWMSIKGREERKIGGLSTLVEYIDGGDIQIIEENPDFISFNLNDKDLKGYYIAKRLDKGWIVKRSNNP